MGGLGGSTGDETMTMTTGPATSDPTTATTTGATGDDTTGADSGMQPPPVDVPDNAYCADVADWSPTWAQHEQDVLTIVNQVRGQGANCGTEGAFAATGPLTMDPALRCAARKHSADMAARNFFDHVNPDGEDPFERIARAGYGDYSQQGENIAGGADSPKASVDGWLASDGHCGNLMSPNSTEIGIGAYEGLGDYTYYWTQTLARP